MQGQIDESEAILRQALELTRESGHQERIGEVTGALGYVLVMKGAYSEASPHVQEALEIARELGNRFLIADGLSSLAQLRRLQGDHEAARSLLVDSTKLFRELDNHAGIHMTLEMLSAVQSEQGRHERAARLAGAASAIRARIGGGAPQPAQMLGDPVGAARAAIGDEAVDRALADGRAMELDEAVGYAVDDRGANA